MNTQLRVLIVEDSESDASLIARRLQKAGYDLEYERVETAEAMRAALGKQEWDLVLADYHLPRFSGLAALEIFKKDGRDMPFIVVSAAIGEETAVDMMKAGAHDYTMKDNLARLVPAVERELREAAGRRARRQADEDLIKSEAILRTVLKGSPSGIGLVVYRVLKWVNDKLLHLTGYTREEIIGQNPRILYFSEAEYKRVGNVTGAQIQANGWAEVETQWRRKDGSPMEIYVNIAAVEPGDLSAGVVFTAMDITECKKAEEALRSTSLYARSLIEASLDPLVTISPEGKITDVNNATEEATGIDRATLIGRDFSDYFTEPDKAREGYQQVLAQGFVRDYPLALRHASGRLMDVLYNATTYTNETGEVQGVFAAARDVTERKKAEEELRTAAQKWRTTFDAIGDAVCLLDRDSRILQCNQAMADLVAKPFPEILGRHCWEVVHLTTGPIDGCPLVRMKKSGKRETLTLPLGDRWLNFMADPILSENGEIIGSVNIIADITNYRQASQKIKDLNALLKTIKEINEALLRVEGETDLFQQSCDLLLGVPYVRFAWIGLVEPGTFEVKPAAWAGAEEGYFSVIKVAWDDFPFGKGPTGKALQTARPFIRSNIETDPQPNPWREEALQRGYKSSIALPLIHQQEIIGILQVYSAKADAFGSEETEFLNQVAGDIAVGVKSLRLGQGLEQSLRQLQIMIHQTVETMASIVETRDPYTAGHQHGVAQLAVAIAAEMRLDADRLQGLQVAGLLHDIGKMTVPAEILSKPEKLSALEFSLIKAHSQVGAGLLQKIDFPWPVAQIVLQHHERLDGSGYPAGLAGPDILLEAKILAVADVVEAMSSHRPYRPALGIEEALKEITKNKGILYDLEVVDVCVRLFTEKGFQLIKNSEA